MIAIARSMLGLACFILVGSVAALLIVERDTPEFVVSCISLGLGLVGVCAALLAVRWSLRREPFLKGTP